MGRMGRTACRPFLVRAAGKGWKCRDRLKPVRAARNGLLVAAWSNGLALAGGSQGCLQEGRLLTLFAAVSCRLFAAFACLFPYSPIYSPVRRSIRLSASMSANRSVYSTNGEGRGGSGAATRAGAVLHCVSRTEPAM
jgi:hypothetical protein